MDYNDQYQKENIVRIVLKLNRKTDMEIIDRISQVQNKQGYLKKLIKKDIERNDDHV